MHPLGEADIPPKQRMCLVWRTGSIYKCSHAVDLFSLSTVPLDGLSHAVCPLQPFMALSDNKDSLSLIVKMFHVVSNLSILPEL